MEDRFIQRILKSFLNEQERMTDEQHKMAEKEHTKMQKAIFHFIWHWKVTAFYTAENVSWPHSVFVDTDYQIFSDVYFSQLSGVSES